MTNTVAIPSVISSGLARGFRPVLRSALPPSASTRSLSLVSASQALSDYVPGSSAVSAGIVINLDSPAMVTASSLASPVPSSCPDASAAPHDSDDEEHKTALDMMRTQREEATSLAADRIVEIENARADLDVSNATIQRRNASLVSAREETKKLREELVRVNVEACAVSLLRRDNHKLRNDLKDKDAEITCLRELLIVIRDTASGGLPSSL